MFNLDKAQNKVVELNKILQSKCDKKLSLELGFHSDFKNRPNASINKDMNNPQIILCLNYANDCISSIACKINKKTRSMEISSKTNATYESKKYNTLMRSVTLLVAPLIQFINARKKGNNKSIKKGNNKSVKKSRKTTKTVNKIISRSINPISTLLLVKYFDAKNDEFDKYLEEDDIDKSTLTLDQVKEFQTVEPSESLTSSEELANMENNESFGEPLLLTVDLTDIETMKKIQNTFDETMKKVGCP